MGILLHKQSVVKVRNPYVLFQRTKNLTPVQASAALRRGELQLVDVREHAELSQGRVDGAKHIPLAALSQRLHELDQERPVAFLCRSGSRSAIATRHAAKAGLDAANVKGGVLGWSRAGLPLASARGRRR